jgi:hypothetical protein
MPMAIVVCTWSCMTARPSRRLAGFRFSAVTLLNRMSSGMGEEGDGVRKKSQSERLHQAGEDMIRLLFAINEENGNAVATYETTLSVQKVQEAMMWGDEAIREG